MRRAALLACLVVATAGGGCKLRTAHETTAPAVASGAVASPEPGGRAAPARTCAAPATETTSEPPPRPLRRCFPDRPAWLDAPVAALLDRAAELFDDGDYAGALACAEEATRQAPRSVEAHHNRAISLMRLDRLDEARDSIALALALAPDDPETLEAAADLNINQLPPSVDRSSLGLEYARRGSRHVSRRDRERIARLALLEGQALIDLGRAVEALRRIDGALTASPQFAAAVYERGVALFELCRFEDARRTFEKVLASTPDHAHALYHLGLIEERLGAGAGGRAPPRRRQRRRPEVVPARRWTCRSRTSRRACSARWRSCPTTSGAISAGSRSRRPTCPTSPISSPRSRPLSPTILGLFRGLPLDYTDRDGPDAGRPRRQGAGAARARRGQRRAGGHAVTAAMATGELQCDAGDRTIVLYRRNLLRTVHDVGELDQAITRTLLHEVGHLRGEDDGSLRDRGLE